MPRAPLRQLRRLSAQRFCKQPQSQCAVASFNSRLRAQHRAAQLRTLLHSRGVGLANHQRGGARSDSATSVHGQHTRSYEHLKRLRQSTDMHGT